MNRCALCGRVTLNPAVMIGQFPVGPRCARRAGLVTLAQRRVGLLQTGRPSVQYGKPDPQTLDLFEEPEA